jgi:hypothetical protein
MEADWEEDEDNYLLIDRYANAIRGDSGFSEPVGDSISGICMRSKEFNDLLRGHMFPIICRSWSRSKNAVNSTFCLNSRHFRYLHVEKFFLTNLEVTLLQSNSHGQDLSVWKFGFLGPSFGQLRQMTLMKTVC